MPLRIKLFLSNIMLLFIPGVFIFFLLRNWLSVYDEYVDYDIAILIIICIAALLIIVSIILSYFISESILSPLRKLRKAANEIKNDNLDFNIEYETKDEFYNVIQEFNEMREKLKNTLAENLKYEEEKKQFIASITHDLKTPITVIQGYVEGILDNVANTPEKQKKYLTTIYKKIKDINNLVDDLFMMSKLDLNKVLLNFSDVYVVKYLKEIISEIQFDVDKDVKINLNLSYDAKVRIDKSETFRVIQNIIQNSIKYKGKDQVEINIETKNSGKNILIILQDNGLGIEKDNESKIFEPFFREDVSRKHGEGSGLGLSIAKKIINSENGLIWARGRENGLSIYISFKKID